MKTINFSVIISASLTLLIAISTIVHADDGGRVGTGGPTGCMTPTELKDRQKAYAMGLKILHPPTISVIDPTTAESKSVTGCKIPTGEVKITERSDVVDPEFQKILDQETTCPAGKVRPDYAHESATYAAEREQRMAPVDNCKAIELWTFYRSHVNQLRFHDAPKDCRSYVEWPGNYKPEGRGAYFAYNCIKIPFFLSLEAAQRAKAKNPFAYAVGDSIVIENGTLFITTTRQRFQQKTANGFVLGKIETSTVAPHSPFTSAEDSPFYKELQKEKVKSAD